MRVIIPFLRPIGLLTVETAEWFCGMCADDIKCDWITAVFTRHVYSTYSL